MLHRRNSFATQLLVCAMALVLAVGLTPLSALAAPVDGASADKPAEEKGTALTSVGFATQSESGAVVSGLDGTTVRIRPQGSYSALSIKDDGSGYHNVVHMYHIGGSSRFYLVKADSDSDGDWYKIKYYSSFTTTSASSDVFDIDGPSKDEGKVIHVTGNADKDNKKWRFIQQDDGSYYIKSKYSDKYWSLKDSDKDEDSNKLCQSATPMKWEVEVVASDNDNVMDDDVKCYDSYNIDADGNTGSGTTVTSCNWMSNLSDSTHLTSLSIPGAHDACTCNISIKGLAALYRCQQFYFAKLLNIGVRYYDLRIVKEDGELKLRHGGDSTGAMCKDSDGNAIKLDQVVSWTKSFLEKYPDETVIFQIKDETSKGTASKDIYQYFKDMATEDDSIVYSGDGTPTLGDVRGKIVLVSRISESDAGGDYYIDSDDHSKGCWAICADWQTGSNYVTAKAASTDEYEVWTQDYYDVNADDKWSWVKYGLFGQDGYTGAKDRRDEVEQDGKRAWVVNYTSCAQSSISILVNTPQKNARTINKKLKQSDELSDNANSYLGVVCSDYMDEQLAQRVYSINFRIDPDTQKERQTVSFDVSSVEKTYGDEPFTYTASTTGDGGIAYSSSDTGVAKVDEGFGKVTICGSGTATITATAAETDTYASSSASYTITVDKASLTVTADDKTSIQGDPLPKLTYSITDGELKYGDKISSLGVKASTEATPTSDMGEYSITLSGGTDNSSYDVTLKDGTLTIVPRTATLTFDLAGGTLDGRTGSFTIQARIGDEITIPDAPTREGHTFVHWQGSKYYPGDNHKVEGDHTFTAVWEKNSDSAGNKSPNTASKTGSPNTGDGNGTLVTAISLLAAACLCAIALSAAFGRRFCSKRDDGTQDQFS